MIPTSVLCDQIISNIEFLLGEAQTAARAIYELECVQEKRYGIGGTFCLNTASHACEKITITRTIGEGGSKKPVLLSDGRVIMFPHIDVDGIKFLSGWPNCVTNENTTASFLAAIGVPALNREQAYLMISTHNNAEALALPVLLSDSFNQYAARGWHILDMKKSIPSFQKFAASEVGSRFELSSSVVKPLIQDVWMLVKYGISVGGDSANMAVVVDDKSYKLRYFGFDFGDITRPKVIVPSAAKISRVEVSIVDLKASA